MSSGDIVLAHGVGGRQDLPIPLSAALIGAVAVLLATFLVLAYAWPTSRLRGARRGRPLPGWLARALDSPVFRWALRAFGLLAAGWLVVLLVAGPRDTADSAVPGVLYVLIWVWVPLGSVLVGPVWRAISPLRTLHQLLARATGVDPARGPWRLPRRLGYWPAAAGLAAFVWLELVPRDRATVPVVFLAFAAYAVVMLLGATLFGSGWFARADPFEVYSTLAARLSPIGRRADGVPVLRNPLDGLDSIRPKPGLYGVVLVLLGSTAYDSVSNAPQWVGMMQRSQTPGLIGTLGLAGTIGIIAVAYVAATRATGRLGASRGELPARFAHSILPIALGYVLAHYYALAVTEGQRTLLLAADPFETGLRSTDISYALVPATAVSTLQVVAVVAGHITGAVAAHDRALRLFPPQQARLGQLPLLVLMVGYTYLGLSLLFAV
jgi:hypothetical protein